MNVFYKLQNFIYILYPVEFKAYIILRNADKVIYY